MIFSTVISVVLATICILVGYVALPAITLASAGFWCYLLFVAVCIAIAVSIFLYATDYEDKIFIPWLVVVGFALIFAVCGIASGNAFHSAKAQAVADVAVSEVDIKEDFGDLLERQNQKSLPLVDLDTARLLGDKKIASLKNASWYDMDDEYNLITYQGRLYRLSVVDYGDYFKYRRAKLKGLPGYVLVEVTPENGQVAQEATLVVLDDPIQYSPGAYFSKDLRRHLRSQYPNYMFDSSYLEIDEKGTPYWVTGILRPTAGPFGVKTVTTFVLTNAQNGTSEEYKISEAPDWIDHVYSLNYLMTVAKWHYAYIHGYWNSVFSQTDVLGTSYEYRDEGSSTQFANFFGYSSIVSKTGEVQFYTGLTAANRAESNLGWLTIDASTGKMTQYSVVGAEESSAQSAVETLVQAYEYEATFPLPVNIGGEPSYLMCLKGKSGTVQGYAICNVENYAVAVQAETLDKAISLYQKKLNGEDTTSPESDVAPETTTAKIDTPTGSGTGKIEAIYTAELKGTTQFYYQVSGKLYRAPLTINERQVTFKIGDTIRFTFYPEKDGVAEIATIEKS